MKSSKILINVPSPPPAADTFRSSPQFQLSSPDAAVDIVEPGTSSTPLVFFDGLEEPSEIGLQEKKRKKSLNIFTFLILQLNQFSQNFNKIIIFDNFKIFPSVGYK